MRLKQTNAPSGSEGARSIGVWSDLVGARSYATSVREGKREVMAKGNFFFFWPRAGFRGLKFPIHNVPIFLQVFWSVYLRQDGEFVLTVATLQGV
jgi:hypothetical protein